LCTENSNVHEDHDYYLHAAFDNLNKNYIDDIVAMYIAEFIVFKIAKVISCDICQLYGNVSFQSTNLKKS